MEINWIVKSCQHRRTVESSDFDCDSIVKSTKGKITRIIFRNECASKISKTGYVKVGLIENKIYFDEATSKVGYKVSRNSKKTMKIYLSSDFQIVGNGNLEYDKENHMYFGYVSRKEVDDHGNVHTRAW